ncbi:tyrosine-type recombinase/integrase [Metabacillus sp. YM-086]|uniref:tyrosine-type recombinase/integrase n=1 Tax=Metabacillus sp. YM-086 TaxID=3341729 RepID=UPI003A85EF79
MAGSVNKDKDTGKWFFVLELGKDHNGKRKQKKKRGFKTKKEALAALAEVQNALNKGNYVKDSQLTYKEYLLDWFEAKRNSIGIQTGQVYKHYLEKVIFPNLGGLKLSTLKAIHIQNLINELNQNQYSSATIKKVVEIIKSSLNQAQKFDLIPKNVALNVVLPKKSIKPVNVWNEEEVARFLREAKDDRYYVVFYLTIMTGLRKGEVLALRRQDIDIQKGILKVTQTLSNDGKLILEGAKTKTSIRAIKLSESVSNVLREHMDRFDLERAHFNISTDLLISTIEGTPVNPSNIRRTFNRLIKKADLPKIRFHDLRHTHATLLLSKGVNVKVVSERLGHSNIRVTLDTYSHVLPTMQDEAANKLDGITDNI